MDRGQRDDLEVGIGALLGGIGLITVQLSAVVPGLLAGLILTAALAVPLIIVAVIGGLLLVPPYFTWRVASGIRARRRRHRDSLLPAVIPRPPSPAHFGRV